MADKIVQTGIGLPVQTLLRLDRLRACLGRSRSHVVDYALMGGGLAGTEKELAVDIRTYQGIADILGITWQELTERYVKEFGAKTYPPNVGQLWDMWVESRARQERNEAELKKAVKAVKAEPAKVMTLRDLR